MARKAYQPDVAILRRVVFDVVTHQLAIHPELIRSSYKIGEIVFARRVIAYLLYQASGISLSAVARQLGRSRWTIARDVQVIGELTGPERDVVLALQQEADRRLQAIGYRH